MLHTRKGGRKRECPACLPSVGQLADAWEAAFINSISSWLWLVIWEVAQKQNKIMAVSKQEISSWKCQRASKGIFRRGLVGFMKRFTGRHACCFLWFLLLWFSQADQKVWGFSGSLYGWFWACVAALRAPTPALQGFWLPSLPLFFSSTLEH